MPRVFDCLFLSDETELLAVHLQMLEDVVDRFVVVEGDRTFAGRPKDSALLASRERFAPWWDRIDRVAVAVPADTVSRWDRENAQRAGLLTYLEGAVDEDDVVLLGDVDELVDPALVPSLRELSEPMRLVLEQACWYADWRLPRDWTNGPIAFHRRHLRNPVVRLQLGENHDDWDGFVERRLLGAGIHLWNVASPADVRKKWSTYSHAEYDRERYAGAGFLEGCRSHGVTMEGRWLVDAVAPDGWSAQRRRLAEVAPGLGSGPLPPRAAREAYAGYAWCRTRLPLPAVVWRWWAARPPAPAVSRPLAALHRALLRRRQPRVHADDRWPSTYLTRDALSARC